MQTDDFDYSLPPEFIAQRPAQPRDRSKLMLLDRLTGAIEHGIFRDLPTLLAPGDALVINESRVIPARLKARKSETGGQVELLLLERTEPARWTAIVGGQNVGAGTELDLEGGGRALIREDLGGPRRLLEFDTPLDQYMNKHGEMPLPPYIHEPLEDPSEYQTIYATRPGSAAAPTAGLHFTEELLSEIERAGVDIVRVTLHVGLDTFAPVKAADPSSHPIHSEWCRVPAEAARALNAVRASGGRIVAVGTTSVRTLETAVRAAGDNRFYPWEGRTDLFILPGFEFRTVDALITNFHLPRSTLLMLVSAFAGQERILHAYHIAQDHGYRFYSFGDAMLIR